jgi:hypothetical protein
VAELGAGRRRLREHQVLLGREELVVGGDHRTAQRS